MLWLQNITALISQNLDNRLDCPVYLPELAPCRVGFPTHQQVVEASSGRSLRLSG